MVTLHYNSVPEPSETMTDAEKAVILRRLGAELQSAMMARDRDSAFLIESEMSAVRATKTDEDLQREKTKDNCSE